MNKIKNTLFAAVIAAVFAIAFTPAASAHSGEEDTFSWQYNCDDVNAVTSIVLTTAGPDEPISEASLSDLQRCGVLVFVKSDAHKNEWDFYSDDLRDIMGLARGFGVSVRLELSPCQVNRVADNDGFSPPLVQDCF